MKPQAGKESSIGAQAETFCQVPRKDNVNAQLL
jgi:hypothetical protein